MSRAEGEAAVVAELGERLDCLVDRGTPPFALVRTCEGVRPEQEQAGAGGHAAFPERRRGIECLGEDRLRLRFAPRGGERAAELELKLRALARVGDPERERSLEAG